MARRVKNFVDRAFSRTVDLQLIRRLLEPYLDQIAFEWDSLPDDDAACREAVFDLFAKADRKFPAELQFALYNIATVSTDTGAHLIQEIAEECRIDVLSRSRTCGITDDLRFTPRFIALVTYLDHREIFESALHAAAFHAFSTKLELDADREDPSPRHHRPGVQERFQEAVRAHFVRRYDGVYCEARWFEEDDLLRVLILHGTKPETKNVDQQGVEDTLKFREIVQSTIEYDLRRCSVAVGSKSTTDAKELVRIFGEHILGDANLFETSAKEELYTLVPVQCGETFTFAFDRESDIAHVALRELRIDAARRTAAGRMKRSPWYFTLNDSENALTRLGQMSPEIELAELRIVHAKIDVTLDIDESEIVVPVTVRPPRTVSMRDHSHEHLILELLEDNGIRKRRWPRRAADAAE